MCQEMAIVFQSDSADCSNVALLADSNMFL